LQRSLDSFALLFCLAVEPVQQKGNLEMKRSLRYRLDRTIRDVVMVVMGRITRRSSERRVLLRKQEIKKILLVRGIFRMGDAILATPAITLCRRNFPDARIDFVGPGITKALFQRLPIDRYYEIHRSLPKVCWSYVCLLMKIRSLGYDLAVDASGSSAALGAFIVGFSDARFRVGLRGKWDHWFNVRLTRPPTQNKYENLPVLFNSMGLKAGSCLPSLVLSPIEREQGRRGVAVMSKRDRQPVVGIFVGGRKARGKRWPKQNFLELAGELRGLGANVIIFVGPEERELIAYFRQVLRYRIPVCFDPDPRSFASLVAGCDLFVACDSGPVHLACALRVRTVAIFLKNNLKRWGPPASLARIVYRDAGVTAKNVLDACLFELSYNAPEKNQRRTVNA
jgi:ADP-heptose:LPS heptosyltransferase